MFVHDEKVLYTLLDRYKVDNQERYADKQIKIIELILKDIKRDVSEREKK